MSFWDFFRLMVWGFSSATSAVEGLLGEEARFNISETAGVLSDAEFSAAKAKLLS